MRQLLLVISVLALGFTGELRAVKNFEGEFQVESVSPSGSLCETIFEKLNYRSRLYSTGPGGFTSVLRFTHESGEGFFHELTLVGRNGGPTGQLAFEKTLERNGVEYHIRAKGLSSHELLLLGMSLAANLPNKPSVCVVKAEYSGFVKHWP